MSVVIGWELENHGNRDGFFIPTVQDPEIGSQTTPSPPSRSSGSHNRKRPVNHIPRPRNAFLLFRSDFLSRRIIPEHAEKKQQNLSRVAGDYWKVLPAHEKEAWHQKAREEEADHARKYPNYVYKPVRRENVLKRRQKESEEEKRRRCEELRRTYLPETMKQVPVESSVPPRKRKSRAKKTVQRETVVSTDSLSSDAHLSVVAPASSAFMEPLVAPSNLNQQSLEALHQDAIPESSSFDMGYFGSGNYDQYPVYSDEYYNTLGIDNVAPPAPSIPQPQPVVTTAASDLYNRFRRDKSAGAVTTTAMFNAQYIDQSFFNPQSGFFPSSQAGPSLEANVSYSNKTIFQDLLLPPPAESYFTPNQSGFPQMQGSENFSSIGQNNSFANFPLTVQSNSELPDLNLIDPVYVPPTDTSSINIDLDSFNNFLDEMNLTTLSGNFAQEVPSPLFGDVIAPTNELPNWNDLDNFIIATSSQTSIDI